jgi:hypothetical protein
MAGYGFASNPPYELPIHELCGFKKDVDARGIYAKTRFAL